MDTKMRHNDHVTPVKGTDTTDSAPCLPRQYSSPKGMSQVADMDMPTLILSGQQHVAPAKTLPVSPLGGLAEATLTPQDSQNNLVFIASAMDYLDRLFSTLNQQSVLVQNVQHMFPPCPVEGQLNSPSNCGDGDQSSFSAVDNANDDAMQSETGDEISKDTNQNNQTTSRLQHSSVLNGLSARPVNGAISKKQRYQRTHDVLRKSGLLRIAQKTSELMKESQKIDRQISNFKTVVDQHIADLVRTVENRKLQRAVQVLKANCAGFSQAELARGAELSRAQGVGANEQNVAMGEQSLVLDHKQAVSAGGDSDVQTTNQKADS